MHALRTTATAMIASMDFMPYSVNEVRCMLYSYAVSCADGGALELVRCSSNPRVGVEPLGDFS